MNEANTSVKKGSWIKGLDSIRFVLAVIVFLDHLDNPFHRYLIQSPHLVLRLIGMTWPILFNGVGAVMAFFIISGFVIHYPNKGKYPDTLSFLARRWTRIGLPLLVIGLIASMFHWFGVIPVWSLYCELIYYTLYPLLIRIKISWQRKFFISFLVALGMILFLAPGDWASLFHQKNVNYSGAYWQLGGLLTWIVGLPCWLLGVLLAQQIDDSTKRVGRWPMYGFRLVLLLIGVLLSMLKFHFFVSYFFTMNFLAILLFFWIRQEILYFKDKEPMRLLEFSGKFSYSLYLCHNVFSHFLLLVLPLNLYTYFPIIIFVLVASYLFYLLVEKPSHILSRSIGRMMRAKSIVNV